VFCLGQNLQEELYNHLNNFFPQAMREKTVPSFFSEAYIHLRLVETLDVCHVSSHYSESIDAANYSFSYNEEIFHDRGCIYYQRTESNYFPDRFSYKYMGKAENGIHVLLTADQAGGSGGFMNFLYLVFEKDEAFEDDNNQIIERTLVKRVGDTYMGTVGMEMQKLKEIKFLWAGEDGI
jgi:hypothetical protein